jgi:hypothetical protein
VWANRLQPRLFYFLDRSACYASGKQSGDRGSERRNGTESLDNQVGQFSFSKTHKARQNLRDSCHCSGQVRLRLPHRLLQPNALYLVLREALLVRS